MAHYPRVYTGGQGGAGATPSLQEVIAVNSVSGLGFTINDGAGNILEVASNIVSVVDPVDNLYTFMQDGFATMNFTSNKRIDVTADGIRFKNGPSNGYANIISNSTQTNLFTPNFQLPSKASNSTFTLATTLDYTLQAVTTLANTTNLGIQFQPVTNTGTGSKYATVANNLVYLFSQNEGYSTIANDKIIWSRFGNIVSLSGWNAAGSNSADYILPIKPFVGGPYTLATTADITVNAVTSGNSNNLNVVSSSGTRILYARGLTSSNQSITISATGSSASSTYAWDIKTNPNLLVDYLQFNTASTATGAVGRFVWNDTDGTVDLGLKGGNVTLQVGQEQLVRVVNKTATNITLLESNYQAVRVTGAQGQRLKVDLALATNDSLSAETIGLVTETILNNQEGFVTISGLVNKINTTGSLQSETWNDGDILYLSPTTAGRITNIKPSAPSHMVIIGYVVYSHAVNGKIFVKVNNGYELDELHNVNIVGATAGQVLTYNGTTDIWENKTPIFGSNPGLENWSVNYGTVNGTYPIYFDTQSRVYGSTQLSNNGLTWTNNTITTLSFNVAASVVWVGNGNQEVINTLYISHSTLGYIQSSSIATNQSYAIFDGYSTVVSGDVILQPGESFTIVGSSRYNYTPHVINFIDGRLDIASLFVGEQGPQGLQGATGPSGGPIGPTGATGLGYAGFYDLTSTLSVGAGPRVLSDVSLNPTQTAFTIGTRIRVSHITYVTLFMEGVITSFTGNTLSFTCDNYGGSTSWTGWNISIAGSVGSQGIQGPTGPTGSNGGLTLNQVQRVAFLKI